jgi:2-polyprenyl-3-methyl-5-hydroxy-6-metoxy-1,4-benzoquinol methylase
MLREAGFEMRAYDPIYRDDPSALDGPYDFITCTEVAEHLHRPRDELERLRSLLRPGGLLVIQTRLAVGDEAFADWPYRRDPTHVAFYARRSFEWLARLWNARLEIHGHDVVSLETARDA